MDNLLRIIEKGELDSILSDDALLPKLNELVEYELVVINGEALMLSEAGQEAKDIGVYEALKKAQSKCASQKISISLFTSLITREANPFFAEIHNKKKRMPLVLDQDFEGEWINPDLNDIDIQEVISTSFIRESFQAHEVTRDLYKRDINTNTPRVIEKVEGTGNLFD